MELQWRRLTLAGYTSSLIIMDTAYRESPHLTVSATSDTAPHIERRPASPSTFEALPREIQVEIIRRIQDYNTIFALNCASRIYYGSYFLIRDEIATKITLQILEERNIDIVKPASLVQLSFNDDVIPKEDVGSAVRAIWDSMIEGRPLRWSSDQCRALLGIKDAVIWQYEDDRPMFTDCGIYRHNIRCSNRDFAANWREIHCVARTPTQGDLYLHRITFSGRELGHILPMGSKTYHSISSGFRFGPQLTVGSSGKDPDWVVLCFSVSLRESQLGGEAGYTEVAWSSTIRS